MPLLNSAHLWWWSVAAAMMMMMVWVAVMEWREWSRGGGDGVRWHGSGVVVVTVGWRWWRVAESEYGDRVDPVVRTTFGFNRKNPPENFSGGGGVVAGGGWPDNGRGKESFYMSRAKLKSCLEYHFPRQIALESES
ncbi:hypothetical protein Tco_0606039 [Tanacetum coccineum]